MATVVTEIASGDIDGVNLDFTTTADYVPGTLAIGTRGIWRQADHDDGWTETGGNTFSLKIAPLEGDLVWVRYKVF